LICGVLLAQNSRPRVLVFSKTAGYYHTSIPAGINAIKKIGAQNNFSVDTTTDASKFTDENLKQYKLIVFLSTTGNLFDTLQKQAFQKYVRNGGGVVGIHAATDAEYNWPWYGKLMGGYFESHPKQQTAKLLIPEYGHPATKGLPGIWQRFDEWYNFKELNKDVHVLLTLDERSYTGGKNGDFHPVSWWQDIESGRMFYTALGHTDSSYTEPLFLQHLTGGIMFVLNRNDVAIGKIPAAFDPKFGFDKFMLGANIAYFDTTTFRRTGGPFRWKGKIETTYSYAPAFEQPILVGGVPFNNLALIFDEKGKLIKIWLFRAYRKRWDRDYKETATNHYNELTNYLRTQLGEKGKKKKLNDFKDIYEEGYEWTHKTSKTLVSLYEDKSEKQALCDIRLHFELKE
jgi:type 1 glutamine amidotransferase